MSAFQKYRDAIKAEYNLPDFEVASPFFKLAFDVEVEQAQLRATVTAQAATITQQAERIAALESSDAESVAEFNAGYEAYQRGEKEQDEPLDTKHDQWRVGFAWAAWIAQHPAPVTDHDAERTA